MHPIIYERHTAVYVYVSHNSLQDFKDVFHLFLTNIVKNIPETATLLLAKNKRANTLTSTNYSFLKVVHRYTAVIKRKN